MSQVGRPKWGGWGCRRGGAQRDSQIRAFQGGIYPQALKLPPQRERTVGVPGGQAQVGQLGVPQRQLAGAVQHSQVPRRQLPVRGAPAAQPPAQPRPPNPELQTLRAGDQRPGSWAPAAGSCGAPGAV